MYGVRPIGSVFTSAAVMLALVCVAVTAGDFITAPEVSQIFGELLGLWAVSVWQSMGEPKAVTLAELGPGRGTLMADALRAWRSVPAFNASVSVALIETSPALREAQHAALYDAEVPVKRFDPDMVPSQARGVEARPVGPALAERRWAAASEVDTSVA